MSPDDDGKSSNDSGNKGDGFSWRQATATVGLAMAIPSMIFVPPLVGWWIDRRFGTSPLWFIIGLLAGMAATALDIYRLLKRLGQFK